MNQRKRLIKILRLEQADRVPITDFGYWEKTIERWHKEGLPAQVKDNKDVENYLSLDRCCVENYLEVPRTHYFGVFLPLLNEKIIDEDESTITKIDSYGVTLRQSKKKDSIPQYIRFPVQKMEDFEKLKPRMDGKDPRRYPPDWSEKAKIINTREEPVNLFVPGFFGHSRNLMGLENLSVAYYLQPDLVRAIAEYHVQFILDAYERALNDLDIDLVIIWEDMAYKNGSLISPSCFKEFMTPYYKEITSFFNSKGVKAILVDCDGDMKELIPLFIEAGVGGFFPCEIQSGSDPVIIREEYPKIILIGGIDKRALAAGRQAIDRELEKIDILLKKGGYVPTLDHRVPPDVNFESYKYYCDRKRSIILNPRRRTYYSFHKR